MKIVLPKVITKYLDGLRADEVERVMTRQMWPDSIGESAREDDHCLIYTATAHVTPFVYEEKRGGQDPLQVGRAYDELCDRAWPLLDDEVAAIEAVNAAIREYLVTRKAQKVSRLKPVVGEEVTL